VKGATAGPGARRRCPEADRDALWRTLASRQSRALASGTSRAMLEGYARADLPTTRAPRHRELSARLHDRVGWRIETVPGLVPVADFFALLRERRFPSSEWLRHPDDLVYTPEPDLFHDVFGHVPQLYEPSLRAVVEAVADAARDATPEAITRLERVYWFTIEFGLIREDDSLRAWGAGLASSIDELERALVSPDVQRLPLTLEDAVARDFASDEEQDVYLVADAVEQVTPERLARLA